MAPRGQFSMARDMQLLLLRIVFGFVRAYDGRYELEVFLSQVCNRVPPTTFVL